MPRGVLTNGPEWKTVRSPLQDVADLLLSRIGSLGYARITKDAARRALQSPTRSTFFHSARHSHGLQVPKVAG